MKGSYLRSNNLKLQKVLRHNMILFLLIGILTGGVTGECDELQTYMVGDQAYSCFDGEYVGGTYITDNRGVAENEFFKATVSPFTAKVGVWWEISGMLKTQNDRDINFCVYSNDFTTYKTQIYRNTTHRGAPIYEIQETYTDCIGEPNVDYWLINSTAGICQRFDGISHYYNETLIFHRYVLGGGGVRVYHNETVLTGYEQDYYYDWVDFDGYTSIQRNDQYLECIMDIPFQPYEERKIRVKPYPRYPNQILKYGFVIWDGETTISNANQTNRFLYIDPWADNNYENCLTINFTESDGIQRIDEPVELNLTVTGNESGVLYKGECGDANGLYPFEVWKTDNTTYATIIIKLNATASDTTSLSWYYNYSGGGLVEYDVFDVYDNFNGSSLDAQWLEHDLSTTTFSFSGTTVNMTQSDGGSAYWNGIAYTRSYTAPYTIIGKAQKFTDGQKEMGLGTCSEFKRQDSMIFNGATFYRFYDCDNDGSCSNHATDISNAIDTWHYMVFRALNSSQWNGTLYNLDGSLNSSYIEDTTENINDNERYFFGSQSSAEKSEWEWVGVFNGNANIYGNSLAVSLGSSVTSTSTSTTSSIIPTTTSIFPTTSISVTSSVFNPNLEIQSIDIKDSIGNDTEEIMLPIRASINGFLGVLPQIIRLILYAIPLFIILFVLGFAHKSVRAVFGGVLK